MFNSSSQLRPSVPIAFVDLETTGTNTEEDSITEIGILIIHPSGEVEQWSSLVRPKSLISPFVEKLTGITNVMVADAPRFSELAQEVLQKLDSCLFVAHNVGFDYNVLLHQFRSLGYEFKLPRLCTVKTSRRLLKGFPSYSLGNLCSNLGISLENAHRALDDAWACSEVFLKMVEAHSLEAVLEHAINLWVPEKLPPGFDLNQVHKLSEGPGVIKAYVGDELTWVKATSSLSSELYKYCQGHGPKYLAKVWSQFTHVEVEVTGTLELAKMMEVDIFIHKKPPLNRNKLKAPPIESRRVRDQLLIGKGREDHEVSFFLVQENRIQGYGYFDKEYPPQSHDEIQERLNLFQSGFGFQSELQSWIQYRKFRNLYFETH